MKISVDGEQYEFDPEKMLNTEAIAIERATGQTFQQWSKSAQAGSIEAVTALVWIVRKRQQPDLRFKDVEFVLASVDIEDDEDEDGGDPKGE